MMNKLIRQFKEDSLFRNSIYLMVGTVVMAGFGFVFWMINARLYTPEQIGLASTLISVINLIVTFSLLGMNTGLIRFLPSSERKNEKINTVFIITGLAAVVVSTIFLLGLEGFSPKLLFVKKNLYMAIFFILAMVGMTLSAMIESVYIAYKRAEFVLVKNTIFSLGKVILPFLLVGFGAMGIFGSWTISAIAGFLAVFLILIFKFRYVFEPVFYDSILKRIMPFSFGNYLAGFIGGLPSMVLPLMITNRTHPEITAYYYIAMMIANMLFSVPAAVSNSLFAEGSGSGKLDIRKAARMIGMILVPGIIAVVLFGNYLLLLFGKNYSAEGFRFLQLVALSGVFVTANYLMGTVLRVKHRIKEIVFVSLISSSVIIAGSSMLMRLGLMGIGIAWMCGQAAATAANVIALKR